MSASLKASFILKLEDQLSSGIVALSKKLESLAKLARDIKLTGLDAADRALDRVGASADGASRKVRGIGSSARSALGDLKRLSEQPIMINARGTAFLPPSLSRATMAATVLAAAAAGSGGGGRGLVGMPGGSAPFMGPSIPLLAGPGGGIPLAELNRGILRMGDLRAAAAGVRREFASVAGQVQHVGRELSHLGHAGITAVATGFGLMHPISEYAKYENTLRHIAITANAAREDIPRVVGELTQQYNALANATGQSSEKIAESANFLITTGIGRENVDKLLPLVARAATAYNAPIGNSVQALFSLKENLHVADADMPGTVSAMALAGKEGHFSFSDMSQFLPNVAPLAAKSGLSGSAGARELMAMLETSRRNAGTSGEAETNVRDFISHLYGGEKRGLSHEFKRYGVDLSKVLSDAEKRGISAPEAVIEQVQRLTAGKTDDGQNKIIGNLFHNLQSAQFARGWLADMEYYLKLKERLNAADSHTIDHDFAKAGDAPLVQMQQLQEKLIQIERRLGQGFAPMLGPLNVALDKTLAVIAWLDKAHPGAVDGVLSWVGGFLAIAAALGLLIPVMKLVGSGVMLALTPLRWLWMLGRGIMIVFTALGAAIGAPAALIIAAIAAIGTAAYLIYQNWSQVVAFFWKLWDDVKQIFIGFYEFNVGIFTGDMDRARAGVLQAWNGLAGAFSDLWQAVKDVFGTFSGWLMTTWVAGPLQGAIDAIKSAWSGLTAFFAGLIAEWTGPFNDFVSGIERRIAELRAGPIGRALGLAPTVPGTPAPPGAAPGAAPGTAPGAAMPGPGGGAIPYLPMAYHPGAPQAPIGLNITVQVDQDGRVTGVRPRMDNGNVPRIDRGDTTGRA